MKSQPRASSNPPPGIGRPVHRRDDRLAQAQHAPDQHDVDRVALRRAVEREQ